MVVGRRNHHLDGQLLSFRKLEVPRIVGWDTITAPVPYYNT